jgi:hypothetical protein
MFFLSFLDDIKLIYLQRLIVYDLSLVALFFVLVFKGALYEEEDKEEYAWSSNIFWWLGWIMSL